MQQTHFYKVHDYDRLPPWTRLRYFSLFIPWQTLPNYCTCANFLKSGYFPDALPLKQNQRPPIIFAILTQVTRYNYLTAVKIIRKKSIDWEISRERL